MTQPSKNKPCPCGSGKLYKRCCINKTKIASIPVGVTPNIHQVEYTINTNAFINKYNSRELLKVFALLSVMPENHGRSVRIEIAIAEILNHLNTLNEPDSYISLIRDISEHCPKHPFEDPPSDFFTDLVLFLNGNNIVYTGTTHQSVHVVQHLLFALQTNPKLPERFKTVTRDAAKFILHIHDEIAHKLGHHYRIFKENEGSKLFFLPPEEMIEKKDIFEFSFDRIKTICEKLEIPYDTIDVFVFRPGTKKIILEDLDENPLLQNPFVFVDNRFILALPNAELGCISEFILQQAIKYNCIAELTTHASSYITNEIYSYFARTDWHPVEYHFPEKDKNLSQFFLQESLWQIDADKMAYVLLITEIPTTDTLKRKKLLIDVQALESHMEKVGTNIKKQQPQIRLMALYLFNKIQVLSTTFQGVKKPRQIDQQLLFSVMDIPAIMNNWKLERLSWWKYAKYLEEARLKIRFAPLNSHVSIYDWYHRNKESFFDPKMKSVDWIMFEFGIEGDIYRKGIGKIDRQGVQANIKGTLLYFLLIRKEEYYPVYVSTDIFEGTLRNCLLGYESPIWMRGRKPIDRHADTYINAILYWLHEMKSDLAPFLVPFGREPVMFVIHPDDEFEAITDLENISSKEAEIKYHIEPESRTIHLKLPVEVIREASGPYNGIEQYILKVVVGTMGQLMEALGLGKRMNEDVLELLISRNIPFGNKKMILIATGKRDIRVDATDTQKARVIPDADVSYLLNHQVSWLNNPATETILQEDNDKTAMLNRIVEIHFHKVCGLIKAYNGFDLVKFLMHRHESILQKRAFRKLSYPAKQLCFGKFYNVQERFQNSESDLVQASLAHRVLIEFSAWINPPGKKTPNDDDIDMMIAHVLQIANYGSMSDAINYKTEEIDIALLPSGRLGIRRESMPDFVTRFQEQTFENFMSDQKKYFQGAEKAAPDKTEKENIERYNNVFKKEWGVGLMDIFTVCHNLAAYILASDQSVFIITQEELMTLLKDQTGLPEAELSALIAKLALEKRDNILEAPVGYEGWEVYPWRYNRRISYMMQPVVRIDVNGVSQCLISARHLVEAAENLLSLFFDGRMKPLQHERNILQLTAERSNLKGKEFRNEVAEWLGSHTSLEVIAHEVKIKPKGFLIANEDKGDVDILAVDHLNKTVYSIECKNTAQAKIPYDFHSELDKYFGRKENEGLIYKHVKRHAWLLNNKLQVFEKLKIGNDYQIQSLVLTNSIIPTPIQSVSPLRIVTFYELTSGKTNLGNI